MRRIASRAIRVALVLLAAVALAACRPARPSGGGTTPGIGGSPAATSGPSGDTTPVASTPTAAPALVASPPEVTRFFQEAAGKVRGYDVYRPTRLPEGFRLVKESSSVMGEWTVAAVVAGGDRRLLIIEGAWDLGDEPAKDLGQAAWGDEEAVLLGGVYYAYESEPHRGKEGDAVLATLRSASGETANYMVIGLELPTRTVVDVAASMRRVESR